MTDWYAFAGRNHAPRPCSLDELARASRKRRAGPAWRIVTTLGNHRVSTVFLRLDHAFSPGSRPVLFETMIFRGESFSELYQNRYCTTLEAERGHAQTVRALHRRLRLSPLAGNLWNLLDGPSPVQFTRPTRSAPFVFRRSRARTRAEAGAIWRERMKRRRLMRQLREFNRKFAATQRTTRTGRALTTFFSSPPGA